MTLKLWQWRAITCLLAFLFVLAIFGVWEAQLAEQARMAV